MEYNRLGNAILALLILELFQPPKEGDSINEILGAMSSGVILGTLAFHKATFFLIAVPTWSSPSCWAG